MWNFAIMNPVIFLFGNYVECFLLDFKESSLRVRCSLVSVFIEKYYRITESISDIIVYAYAVYLHLTGSLSQTACFHGEKLSCVEL